MKKNRDSIGTVARILLAGGWLLLASPPAFAAPPAAPAAPKPNAPELFKSGEAKYEGGTGRVEVAAGAAAVSVDGAAETNPAPYEAHLPPGKHVFRASAPGYEALEREVNVAFASNENVSLTLHPAAAPPIAAPTPPPPPPLAQVTDAAPPSNGGMTRRTVAFAAAGVALIGAGLATTFGVLALNNKNDYGRGPTLSNADQGNNDAAYADGAIALAVVAGVTSLVLFLTDDPDSASASTAKRHSAFTASPFLTAHGGGASALLRF